jgi:hypothetical protein
MIIFINASRKILIYFCIRGFIIELYYKKIYLEN